MPAILTLPLDPDQAARLPRYPGRALHALFYQWLALGDYTLAVDVHHDDGPRPFTVSSVYRRDGVPTLRLTVLDDELWPVLERGIAKTEGVILLDQPLKLPEDGPEVQHSTYADLVANARTETRLNVRFLSPTSFRTRGMHYPLPDPVLAFQSWLNRWNEFAPVENQINVAVLDIVTAHVAVSRYNGRTEMVDFGGNKRVVGFTGTVQYTILRAYKIGDEWLRKLNVLADYAPFCGTGHKTAQGMGQTLRY
ncbi:MAG: CRISPR system precrRNA processing endoribonuclease RAMP protein Cas6 [Anaerolineae bacterium]